MKSPPTPARILGLGAAAVLALGLATAGNADAAATQHRVFVRDDTLIIRGTAAAEVVQIRVIGADANAIRVDFDNGDFQAVVDRRTFTSIDADLFGGDDHFEAIL